MCKEGKSVPIPPDQQLHGQKLTHLPSKLTFTKWASPKSELKNT